MQPAPVRGVALCALLLFYSRADRVTLLSTTASTSPPSNDSSAISVNVNVTNAPGTSVAVHVKATDDAPGDGLG